MLQKLQDIGYTKEKLENIYYLTQSSSDFELLTNLFEGTYSEAFNVPIDELGENTKTELAHFAIALGEALKTGNTELQNFVNGLLYLDENRHPMKNYDPQEYLKLLLQQTQAIREMYTALLFTGQNCGDEARENSRNISQMYSFWGALFNELDKGNISSGYYYGDKWYSLGECYIQIKDIGLMESLNNNGEKDEDIYFKIVLMDSATNMQLNELTAVSLVVWSSNETSQDEMLDERRKIQEEIDALWVKQGAEGIFNLMKIHYPELANGIALAMNIAGQSVSDTVSGIQDQKINGKEWSNDTQSVFSVIAGITGYLEARNALQEKYDDNVHDSMLGWFYCSNQYVANGEPVYLADGIYNYDVIQSMIQWNEKGIGSWLDEPNSKDLYNRVITSPKNNFSEYSQEEKNALAFMIYGKDAVNKVDGYTGKYDSILKIDGAIFTELVNDIDNAIYDNDADIQLLWKEHIWLEK